MSKQHSAVLKCSDKGKGEEDFRPSEGFDYSSLKK